MNKEMNKEANLTGTSGAPVLVLVLFLYATCIALFIQGIRTEDAGFFILFALCLITAILGTTGFFVVNPNQAAALLLFGRYKGTVRGNGFRWANPFTVKRKISLRARNLNGDKLKVNDLDANPIEIATVVVWKVLDTFKALFEVEDYEEYVRTQSESAVRKLASAYPYDGHEDMLSLRGDTEEINEHLETELGERLNRAGIKVIEARLSHLAYAPEIAGAMLQRQQASAVVQARKQIVEGAVGMVELALDALGSKGIVELDEEKKATMVSNLLVVLCSESSAQPVVNTGTLYQ